MNGRTRNVKIVANVNDKKGMDIFLNHSGHLVYLMSHKYSEELFDLIKDGRCIDDLRRSKNKHKFAGNRRTSTQRRRSNVLQNMIEHVLDVADIYLTEELYMVA